MAEHEDRSLAGIDEVVLRYAQPLLRRLRAPKEDWPTSEDFLKISQWPSDVGPRHLTQCFHEIETFGAEKDDLDKAGSRLIPSCCSSLPVQVALFC